jgi:RsiW-degrading membrane proteinase PrsW (M82 family)
MILTALLVLALVAALWGATFLVLWLDRYRTEPVPRLVLLAFWGLLCPLVLRLAGPAMGFVAGPDPILGGPASLPLVAGIVEELILALGLAVVAMSHYLDGPLDGAVFGTVAGLGFAAAQNVAALHAGWLPASLMHPLFMTLVRAAVTAAVGSGIGLAKLTLRMWLRVPCALAVVLVASVARRVLVMAGTWGWSIWGARDTALNVALVAAALLLLVGVFLGALALERRVIARQLADEVALGVLLPWVAEVLPSYWRRIRSDWWRRRDERREIVRLLTSLAFRKHQLRVLSEERARLYGLEVGRLRQRSRTLLALSPDAESVAEGEA